MLQLQRCQAKKVESILSRGSVPRMNSTLFLTLKAVIMNLFHEW